MWAFYSLVLRCSLSAVSLGKGGWVSLGDVAADGKVQDWPSWERLGTRLGLLVRKQATERFHSRGQHLCKFIGTKESVYIRKAFNFNRNGLEHQHGRRDVTWKRFMKQHKQGSSLHLQHTDVTSWLLRILCNKKWHQISRQFLRDDQLEPIKNNVSCYFDATFNHSIFFRTVSIGRDTIRR